LRYPPTEDQSLKDAGCFILAIKPTSIDTQVDIDDTKVVINDINNGIIQARENKKNSEIESIVDKNEKKSLKGKINREGVQRLASLSSKMDEMDAEEGIYLIIHIHIYIYISIDTYIYLYVLFKSNFIKMKTM
jgi:hypothetical protein